MQVRTSPVLTPCPKVCHYWSTWLVRLVREVRVVGDGSHLSASEAADLLGYGKTTVHRMFDDGELAGYTTPGGHRRIDALSVTRLLLARPASPQRDAAIEQLRQSGVDVDKPVAE